MMERHGSQLREFDPAGRELRKLARHSPSFDSLVLIFEVIAEKLITEISQSAEEENFLLN